MYNQDTASKLTFFSAFFVLIWSCSASTCFAQINSPIQAPHIYVPEMLNDFKIPIDAGKQRSSSQYQPQPGQTASPTYTPSKSLRKKNLANFVSKTRATDPAGADQMEQLFANGDIIGQIDSAIAPYGLTASNTADAYAVWWVAAWQVANSDTRDVNGATYKAVSGQAARGFATSPEFANATDAQKQEMAEAMLIQAAMIDAAKDNFAGDPAMMKQLATAVKQGAKKSGLDFDTMTLTDEGFAKADQV
jgi:hypothetical protein